MQKAQSPESLREKAERMKAEVLDWMRDLGPLETWKKVADQRVHMIFYSVPAFGPTMSDELKRDAIDAIYRLTLYEIYECMTEDEGIAYWRENHDAMEEYASALAEKTVAERWKRALANSR